ncbi:amidase family protein [Thozetella sp. PMI_491]|nr:amidase family protein [Thozetella sp. PMI_491]
MVTFDPFVATATDVQRFLQAGELTSSQLLDIYLGEIAKNDEFLRAIIAQPPREWLCAEAARLDEERANGNVRGPLHGIPILMKARQSSTTCGSLALAGSYADKNAKIIDMLRDAGTIILAKASLSDMPSGWCGVSGQGQSPYVDGGLKSDDNPTAGHTSPTGSSSGSAIGVAAGFAPISIGAENCGSLVIPACRAALYAIKPTVGIVPDEGSISLSIHNDAMGPMAKNAKDIADILDVIVDPAHIPSGGYAAALTRKWDNIRVGVVEPVDWCFGFIKKDGEINSQLMAGWKAAYELLEIHAASCKRVKLISIDEATADDKMNSLDLANRDFPKLLKDFLAGLHGAKVHDIHEVIEFNKQHADQELPANANNQDTFIELASFELSDERYEEILAFGRRKSRDEGFDKVMKEHDVNIVVGPCDSSICALAAMAEYPIISVPYGNVDYEGNCRPYGIFAVAAANQDALLVEFMSAWETVAPPRKRPSKTKFP